MAGIDIGTTLKELRLSRGIILEEVEQVTHISLRYLRAIEDNQFEVMPGMVYARAYVRKYAEYLGLDSEPLIAAFKQQTAPVYKLEVQAEQTPSPPVEAFLRRRNPWARILWILLGIAVVVIGGLVLANILLPAVNPPETTPPTASPSIPLTPSSSVTISPSGTATPTSTSPSPSVVPPVNQVEVRVTARESGHIEVISEGRTQFDGTLDAGNTYTFRQHSFTITFDDPTHFDLTIDGNSQAIPAAGTFQFSAP